MMPSTWFARSMDRISNAVASRTSPALGLPFAVRRLGGGSPAAAREAPRGMQGQAGARAA